MLIVILVILALSLLVLAHEAGHFFTAKAFGMKVDEFGFGFPPEMVGLDVSKVKLPPRMWSFQKGETLYSVNWLPFGGFVKIAGEADGLQEPSPADVSEDDKKHLYRFQAWWKRGLVLAAGVIVNFVLGWFLLSAVLAVGTPQVLLVGGVQAGSPAERVGIKEGDLIKNFSASNPFINFVNAHRGEEVAFSVIRNGEEMKFKIVPRVKTNPGEGAIGVSLVEGGAAREGIFTALYHGLTLSVKIAGLTFVAFYDLVRNLLFHASLMEGVVGPIGIVSVAAETSKLGLIFLLGIIAQISLSLAVVNFIPFPALDGGQFFMVLIEKIKGSPLFSKQIEGHLNAVGFIFLILLIVLITFRDVAHLL